MTHAPLTTDKQKDVEKKKEKQEQEHHNLWYTNIHRYFIGYGVFIGLGDLYLNSDMKLQT